MAITNGYTTLAIFKTRFLPSATANSADDTEIENIITATSRYIDQECYPRTFYARTGETHYFDLPINSNMRMLYFNDYLITATTLTNGDATVISATSYWLYPISERATTAVEVPSYKLELKPSASITFVSDTNGDTKRVVSLLGTWGYCTTYPADIEQACLEIARNIYNRRTGQGETAATITPGGVMVTPIDVSAIARRILDAYPKHLGITDNG